MTYEHQTPFSAVFFFFTNYTCFDMSRLCLNYSDPSEPTKIHQTHSDPLTETTYGHQTPNFCCFSTNYTCFDMSRLCLNYSYPFELPKNSIPSIYANDIWTPKPQFSALFIDKLHLFWHVLTKIELF